MKNTLEPALIENQKEQECQPIATGGLSLKGSAKLSAIALVFWASVLSANFYAKPQQNSKGFHLESEISLHELLDFDYGSKGYQKLQWLLAKGADPNQREGVLLETPLHVATRRSRLKAVEILLDHGAQIDAKTVGGKTAYAHAKRRGFHLVAELLQDRGADTTLNIPDQLAVALADKQYKKAKKILAENPKAARTGNPEEDRLLADLAGKNSSKAVAFLIKAGADLKTPGLDGGSPLHQAAWFGQLENAKLLIEAGAPINLFDGVHEKNPLGWAVHGSQFSGFAEKNHNEYVALIKLLKSKGSLLHYPHDPDSKAYLKSLIEEAGPFIRAALEG